MRVLISLLKTDLRIYFSSNVAVFWTVLFPLVLFSLLYAAYGGSGGYSFGTFTMAVADHDKTGASKAYLARIDALAQGGLPLDLHVQHVTDCRTSVTSCLRIPTEFGTRLATHRPSNLRLVIAAGNPMAAAILTEAVDQATNHFVLQSTLASGRPVLDVVRLPDGVPPVSKGRFLAIGTLILSMLSTALMGFATPLVAMRERGLFKLNRILPAPSHAFLLSYSLSRIAVMLIITFGFLLFVQLVFHVRFFTNVSGSVIIMAIVAAGAMTFVAIGLAIASSVASVASAGIICSAFYLAFTFLGDLFLPISSLPHWLQVVSGYLPTTRLAHALTSVTSAWHAADIVVPLEYLAVWTIATVLFAWSRFAFARPVTMHG